MPDFHANLSELATLDASISELTQKLTGRQHIFSGPYSKTPSLSIRGRQTASLSYLPSCQRCSLEAVVALLDSPKTVAVNRALQKRALSPDLITEGPAEHEDMGSNWSPSSPCLQTQNKPSCYRKVSKKSLADDLQALTSAFVSVFRALMSWPTEG